MEDLANMALTLALTRTMLSLPYRADTAEDLERAVRVAIRAASLSRHFMASSPQHPYVSTAKGMQTQPKRLHFASLEACLRASAADAVDPAVTLASFNVVGFSGDVSVKSNAAGLPNSQFWTRMSAGRVCLPSSSRLLPASSCPPIHASLQDSQNVSRRAYSALQ